MNYLSVSEVFLHLRAPSQRRGWRGTGWPARRAGRGELARPPPCWDPGVAAGPWPCVVAGTAKRPEQACEAVPRTRVYFPELRGGIWEGELPRGPGGIPLSPPWGLGISGSIPGSGAPSAPARCSPPSRSQGYVHKGTAVRRSAWAVLGVSSPREHRPPGLAAVPAVRGGPQGSLAGAAARLRFCSLPEESLRLALRMALPQAGPRRGRKGPGAGTGAAVTLLGDSVAWEHSGSCRCRWHTTAAR